MTGKGAAGTVSKPHPGLVVISCVAYRSGITLIVDPLSTCRLLKVLPS